MQPGPQPAPPVLSFLAGGLSALTNLLTVTRDMSNSRGTAHQYVHCVPGIRYKWLRQDIQSWSGL